MKSNRKSLFYSVFSFSCMVLLSACGTQLETSQTRTNASNVPPTFQKPSLLQISLSGLNGTPTGLLIAKFKNTKMNDIIVLTTNGARLYENRGGQSWLAVNLPDTALHSTGAVLSSGLTNASDFVLYNTSQGFRIFKNSLENPGQFALGDFVASGAVSPAIATITSGVSKLMVASATGTQVRDYQIASRAFVNNGGIAVGNPFTASAPTLRSGDLNADGFADLVLALADGGQSPQIFKTLADATLPVTSDGGAMVRTKSTSVFDVQIAQMVGDGFADIALATDEGIEIYRNRFKETERLDFDEATNSPLVKTESISSFVAADINHNGTTDFFFNRGAGKTSAYLMNLNDGNFADVTATSFGVSLLSESPTKVYAADIDGDQILDIVELYPTKISVYINNLDL